MKKRVVFLFLLISMMVSSSRALQGAKALEQIGPQFHCRVGHFLTNTPDSVRLLVAIAVPYDNLQFIRSDSGFSAFFELVSSVYDSQGVLIAEKMSYPKARTTNYAETNLMTKVVAHTDDFLLGPGDYRVRVVLTERESNRESRFEAKMPLRATDPLLQLSDIFWAAQETSAHDLGDLRVVDLFFTDEDSALARFQTASTGKESLLVRWQIRGASGADTLERHQFRVAAGAEPATRELRVDLKGLTGGGYHLHVEAEANSRRIERKLPFRISLRGMPRSIVELDLAIRQLRPIATGEEMRRMQEVPPYRREEVFRDFWRRRDPTPGTEENELMDEYYYRVEYANANFKTHHAGWETDRGRIYILYGEPSDIERHPFEINSKPYEIWYYDHLNRRFVFVDYTGFGDYELVGPEWGR